jgi:hypothetical protein
MILNIEFENYRTFRNRVDFSLIAEPPKSKDDNLINLIIGKNESIRLLKTAAIFGANGSGKSTLFRGLYEVLKLIVKNTNRVGDKIQAYDPFLFNNESPEIPTKFAIDFIGKGDAKYRYELIFDQKNIIHELLEYYPNNKSKTLFKREIPENRDAIKHIGLIGSPSKNKKVELFHNQPLLSKFGTDIPDEIISDVFLYFQNIEVVNATNSRMLSTYNNEIKELANKDNDFLSKINSLIRHSDTGLNEIIVSKIDDDKINFPENFPENFRNQILKDFKYNLTGFHDFYEKDNLQHKEEPLPFEEESTGTKTLFVLGGILLKAIKKGIPIFVDEIDTSLHPYLAKLLISLFQNERINTNNSQLIFTSHDTNLLDRRMFRKDQVWFTEKDEKGISDLFSLQDFSDVRENTPFERWYLAGKFGAIPNIKSIEKLF